MSSELLIYYFGDDEAYFKSLQGEFKKHAKVPTKFVRFYETDEKKIQALLLKVFRKKPACVFIDFSKKSSDYLHLARILSRTHLDHQFLVVGLLDYLSPLEVLKESTVSGTHLNFVKSAETYDVIFDVMKLISPENIGENTFACADLVEQWDAGILCKIGHVSPLGLHIETNFSPQKGETLILEHPWLEKRIIPSKYVSVTQVSNNNLYYHFNNSIDLDFQFLDEFVPTEGMLEEKIKEKTAERAELLEHHKKQLKKWIDANIANSQEKKAKVLVVDNQFHFYDDGPRTDKSPYTIRCIPFFNNMEFEINRLRPQIIAFEVETGPEAKNTMGVLEILFKTLNAKFSELRPYVIVFNSELNTLALQQRFQYPLALGHSTELGPETLIKMTQLLEAKISKTPTDQKVTKPNKVFIKKDNVASVAKIIKPVTITKLSEVDMVIQSEYSYAPGTNLYFKTPVEMFVHLTPSPKPSGKLPEYYGLIHSISETSKKELRRYVNSVFFRDHDAEQMAEIEEFTKLNELKLQERAAAEEAAKKEAEALKEDDDSQQKQAPQDGEELKKVKVS